ncbi:glycoside hydrolase family 9 protein [Ideonella sp. DXS29W]|uniref:Endoglucanase n=1 Tax=Ideonella lacteola TaxID=2984193 RepID=A0ABU9BYE7_9BURK
MTVNAADAPRQITLDLSTAQQPVDRFFDLSVGADFPGTLRRDDSLAQLKTAVDELGFRSIRFHALFHDVMGAVKVEGGRTVHDFSAIDRLYDDLLSRGIRPFVELGFTPQALATSQQTIFYWKGNTSHPRRQAWVTLVDAFVRHLIQRYGADEVRKWPFEVWNEPNLDGFWERADQPAYFELYAATARAIKRIDSRLRVGGPSTAGAAWVPEFLAYAKAHETPVDFVTTHTYGVDHGFLDEYGQDDRKLSPHPDSIIGDVRRVRAQIEASPFPGIPLYITEWSTSYNPRDLVHDSYISAPWILTKLRATRGLAQAMSYWTYSDLFEEAGPPPTPFHGGFGLLTREGVRKPAFFAYKYLNALRGKDIPVTDAAVLAAADGHRVAAVVWDWQPPDQSGDKATNRSFFGRPIPSVASNPVAFKWQHLAPGRYRLLVQRTGYRSNDAQTLYFEMGSPPNLSAEQLRRLQSQTQDKPEVDRLVTVDGSGTLRWTVPMRSNDVVLVTLQPERAAGVGQRADLAQPGAHEIQLNQVGYLPGAAKMAAVPAIPPGIVEGNGAAPAVARRFSVVEAGTGQVAFEGELGAPAVWPLAHASVQLADFSALTRPGRYRLRAEGAGDSAVFTIDAQAYGPLSAASLKAFYFNRASTALLPQHAGAYARPAGHPDTEVRVHASAAGPTRPEGAVISAAKGWYDAGDYNKYIVNSGISTYTLLAAYEHYPAWFRQQTLNIPESGGAVPDVLAETLWNLDWMLQMQDPADGGVYHKLTDKSFDGAVMPHQSNAPRYVVQKTTAAALDFAAVMAAASRVLAAYEAARPGLSARMQAAAEAAWQWAQAHPNIAYRQPADVHTGAYDDEHLADEFVWAAAELYITTRDDRYWAELRQALQKAGDAAPDALAGVPSWGSVAPLAWVSLAHHRDRLTPAADRALIERRIRAQAEALAAAWRGSAYRVSLQASDLVWGSNSGALNQALMLLQGYRLGGERAQLDAAQSLLDYVLGRNAVGISMVTGFGTRSTQQPHHRPSMADGVAAPVPGFLAGGPNPGLNDAAHCPVPYPSDIPARSYLDHDCSYASNEVAINWNAPLAYVAAALQVLTPAPDAGLSPQTGSPRP